jgi:hypothetical protein
MGYPEIRKMLEDCDRAIEMPQNGLVYPAETDWLDDYTRILRYVCRIRAFKREVEHMESFLKKGKVTYVSPGRFRIEVPNSYTAGFTPNYARYRQELAVLLTKPESESYPALADMIRDVDARMKAIDEKLKAIEAAATTTTTTATATAKPTLTVTDTIEHV